jgi:sterol desaturase/sphingolipid hydroxylase (fatty acid hydroxylase superfamily)
LIHHLIHIQQFDAASFPLPSVISFAHSKLLALRAKVRGFKPVEHLMLFYTWGSFLIAAAIAFYVEVRVARQELSARSFLSFCFPAEGWKSHSARTDVLLYFFRKITAPLLGTIAVVWTGLLSYWMSRGLLALGFPHRMTKGGVGVAVVLGTVLFIANDFASYVSHLAEHKFRFLWEFHRVHHTATFLSPLTTEREHPVVMVVDGMVGGILLGALMGLATTYYGYSMIELLGMLAAANMVGTLITLDALRHSQFPVSLGWFDKILISPHMHQLHHSVKESHWNKNMGNKLSIWDGIFKTGFIPVQGEALQYGSGSAADDHAYRSAMRCYCMPFINNFRTLKVAVQTLRETANPLEPK